MWGQKDRPNVHMNMRSSEAYPKRGLYACLKRPGSSFKTLLGNLSEVVEFVGGRADIEKDDLRVSLHQPPAYEVITLIH